MIRKSRAEKVELMPQCTNCGDDGEVDVEVPCDSVVDCDSATNGHHLVTIDCPCCSGEDYGL